MHALGMFIWTLLPLPYRRARGSFDRDLHHIQGKEEEAFYS